MSHRDERYRFQVISPLGDDLNNEILIYPFIEVDCKLKICTNSIICTMLSFLIILVVCATLGILLSSLSWVLLGRSLAGTSHLMVIKVLL